MMNKRGFLLSAASAVAVAPALAAATPAPGALATDGRPMLAGGPGLADWKLYLGQRFELSDGRQRWAVTLASADSLATAELPVRTEQFVLGFVNQGQGRIPAGTVSLRHANGQSRLIHLSDSGQAKQQLLRAEFNLLLQPA